MSWFHKPGRQWHYALPGFERFICGSFFVSGAWETSLVIPDRGFAICVRCERLMLHAVSGALSYKGQSGRKVRGRFAGANR